MVVNVIIPMFRIQDGLHMNGFLEFHELGKPVINNAGLMLVRLYKSLEADILLVSENLVKISESHQWTC